MKPNHLELNFIDLNPQIDLVSAAINHAIEAVEDMARSGADVSGVKSPLAEAAELLSKMTAGYPIISGLICEGLEECSAAAN